MIIGLGSDLCNIERIEAALARHGNRFEQRCFTEVERAKAARLAQMTPSGHEAHIHLTLTDDHPWAQAFVVIEARPI